MSSRPTATSEAYEASLFQPVRTGSECDMMTDHRRTTFPSSLPPRATIPGSRPHLPPPSQLEPSFIPQSPQVRPQYSDLSTRPLNYANIRQSTYDYAPSQDLRTNIGTSTFPQRSTQESGYPHPPLYPQKVSYQSSNPGTLYEAQSPIEYMHGSSCEPSLFNEGGYTVANPYPASSLQQHRSPTSSYHSSATSSSGRGTGPVPLVKTGINTGTAMQTANLKDRYVIIVRQQPIAARACGFGERDRRVIDPPPIVQMSLKNFDPNSPSDLGELRWPFNIVHCALLAASPESSTQQDLKNVTAVEDPNQSNRLSRRLMGTLVASPFVGIDPATSETRNENSRLGCFFIFPDLSCRQNGLYRLRFTLMKVSVPNMTQDGQGSLAGHIDSDVFEVFSAKDFPGMRASTALTKELKRQGATVSVKKGKGQRKGGSSRSERSSDDGSDQEGELPKQKQRKKRS